MPETFREKMGYVLAVLVMILVFTGMGLIIVPSLAPLLVLSLFLDLGMLALISGAFAIEALKEWLGKI